MENGDFHSLYWKTGGISVSGSTVWDSSCGNSPNFNIFSFVIVSDKNLMSSWNVIKC